MLFLAAVPDITPIQNLITTWTHIAQALVASIGALAFIFAFIWKITAVESHSALAAIWASYRIMWGQGLRSQYSARVLLPRLFMGAVLINFSLPMFQAVVVASNTVCDVIQRFGTIPDQGAWRATFSIDPADGLVQVITMGILAIGFDVLAIAYLIRYTILILLAITAPLAGLLFVLPETNHLEKQWR